MAANHRNRNSMLAGIILFICVTILLLVSPADLFSPMVTFIDTELYRSSGTGAPVRTTTDFGSAQVMTAFPREIDKWTGSDYDMTEYVKSLGAEAVLLRLYEPSTFSQPLFFTIVQAKTEASFHPPKVCLAGQGFKVQEEGEQMVPVPDAAWVKDSTSSSMRLKRLVVAKSAKDGTVTERRVVILFYVKGNQFYDDTITMIQVDALAPIQGSYEGTLNEELAFISKAIPLMFEPRETGTWNPLIRTMAEWGVPGYFIIACLILTPVLVALYPRLRRRDPSP